MITITTIIRSSKNNNVYIHYTRNHCCSPDRIIHEARCAVCSCLCTGNKLSKKVIPPRFCTTPPPSIILYQYTNACTYASCFFLLSLPLSAANAYMSFVSLRFFRIPFRLFINVRRLFKCLRSNFDFWKRPKKKLPSFRSS